MTMRRLKQIVRRLRRLGCVRIDKVFRSIRLMQYEPLRCIFFGMIRWYNVNRSVRMAFGFDSCTGITHLQGTALIMGSYHASDIPELVQQDSS